MWAANIYYEFKAPLCKINSRLNTYIDSAQSKQKCCSLLMAYLKHQHVKHPYKSISWIIFSKYFHFILITPPSPPTFS